MKVIPVDTTRLGKMRVLSITPELQEDGAQRVNADRLPVWIAETLIQAPDPDADAGMAGRYARSEVERIKVACPAVPEIADFQEARFLDLVARSWSLDGRSGISLSASAVVPMTEKKETK